MSLTLEKLAAQLKAENFNENFYCIGVGWQKLTDGFALEEVLPGKFEFFYTERGGRNVEKIFEDEDEACRYVYDFLSNIKSAKKHIIGFFQTQEQAQKQIAELRKLNVEIFTDSIPYGGINDRRYRVFVFGNDVDKVRNLIELNYE